MNFILHTEFDLSLKEAWNNLLNESIVHVPFLRFEYLYNWWETRGGGEWNRHSKLVLITAHREQTLVGIAPLFWAEHEGHPSLLLLGSIEISDYLSALVRPGDLEEFTSGLFDFLTTHPEIPHWEKLDLYNILEPSPVIDMLEGQAKQRGWSFNAARIQPSPYIELPGDWETYLSSIDKKQRHEIRRKIRRLENGEVNARWYFVKDAETLDDEINDFFALMVQDPQKESFLTEEMATAMANTIHAAFDHGYLQLAFLEIEGEKAAAYLSFDYFDRIWLYNSGFNDKFLQWSPGWVLLGYLLQWANDNHRKEFDFLRGDEQYKYRFGAKDRFVYRITLSR